MTDVDTQQIRRTNGPGSSPWRNEALCERVHELWKDHSASQIADRIRMEFRVQVSRNAIVGYLHRQKITVDDKVEVHPATSGERPKRIPPSRRPATPVNVRSINAAMARPRIKPEPFVCAPVVDLDPLHMTLADLKDGNCRFPFGDDPAAMTFCGHPTVSGRSWCPKHFAVVTVPTPARRQSTAFIARGAAA